MLKTHINKKWSSDTTIQFLELYAQYPCLWDTKLEGYRNKDIRERAYEKIAKAMELEDFGVFEVKAKIRSMRNSYALEVTKIIRSKKFSTKPEDIYVPKVKWFPVADRILGDVIHKKNPEMLSTNKNSLTLKEFIENTKMEEEDEESDIETTSKNTEAEIVIKPSKRPRKSMSITWRRESPQTTLKLPTQKSPFETPTHESDTEYECFGKLIARQLEKLPEAMALEAMAFIQSYLVEKRLETTQTNFSGENDSFLENNESNDIKPI